MQYRRFELLECCPLMFFNLLLWGFSTYKDEPGWVPFLRNYFFFYKDRYIKTSEERFFSTWGISLSVDNNIHVDISFWEKSHLFPCWTNAAWLERKRKERTITINTSVIVTCHLKIWVSHCYGTTLRMLPQHYVTLRNCQRNVHIKTSHSEVQKWYISYQNNI